MTRDNEAGVLAQACALVLGLAAAGAAQAGPLFHIEMVPIQNGLTPTKAYGINNHGEATGTAYNLSGQTVCFKYAAGAVVALPNSNSGYCSAINDAGDILGAVMIGGTYKPAVWPAAGGRVLLPMVDAGGINAFGQIAGTAEFDGVKHAAIWDRGVLTDLGTLGGSESRAVRLNDDGKVVGSGQDAGGAWRPTAWQAGVAQQVCQHDGASQTFSTDVNASGQLLCSADLAPGSIAFIQDEQGNHDIPSYKDYTTIPSDFNDGGEVVGIIAAPQQAFYSNGKKTYKLFTLLDNVGKWSVLRAAYAINNAGQIVGTGNIGHKDRAFIATPVSGRDVPHGVNWPSTP